MALKLYDSMYTGKKVSLTLDGVASMNGYNRLVLLSKFMRNYEQNFSTQGIRYDTLTGTFSAGKNHANHMSLNFKTAEYSGEVKKANKFVRLVQIVGLPVSAVKEIPFVIISKYDLQNLYTSARSEIEKYLITFHELPLQERLWKTYINVRVPNSVDASVEKASVNDVGYHVVEEVCRECFPDAFESKEKKK